ncbi:MAG TPA: fibronectin type III domain-containing protein [Candidatus Acidoferrum sp.]|nr:fibronectin type III domain-containing protein [Candidatus Acidoferrum sp.]
MHPSPRRTRKVLPFLPLIALQISAAFAGCASPGEPVERKPPTPLAINDLAAEQTGNTVVLTFTVPKETVDRNPLADPPAVEIYRAIHASGASASQAPAPALLVTIPSAMVGTYTAAGRLRYIDSLTAGDFLANQQQSAAMYAIRTRSSPKKESADSNRADLNIYPAPQPVTDLQAQVAQAAIALSWTAPSATLTGEAPQIAGYRLYRANAPNPGTSPTSASTGVSSTGASAPVAPANAAPAPQLVEIGESPTTVYEDTTAQRNKTYTYSVRSTVQVPSKLLESADSNLATVTLNDVYPPGTPTQLIATPVPAENGTPAHIDLSWAINPETDLAGYNVYRSEQSGESGTRLNPQPLPTPTFRDMNAVPGRSYFYTVTAVDRTGNESAASAAVQGALPAESQASP